MTNPEMLRWQYQEIIWELGEIQRHGSDPNCPCNLAEKGEYCLPKHALSLHGLARETIPMESIASHKDLLADLQDEALDYHNKLKDRIICLKPHKDEGDVVEWARSWRKKIETIYYTCSARLHMDKSEPKVIITGKCAGDVEQCEFTVKRDVKRHKIVGVDEMVQKAMELVHEKTGRGGKETDLRARPVIVDTGSADLTLAPETVKSMIRVANQTRKHELGFPLCKMSDGLVHPGEICKGATCSIHISKCVEGKQAGFFHTHPSDTLHIQHSHSVGDLTAIKPSQIICVSGQTTNKITCAALKKGQDQIHETNHRIRTSYPYLHPDVPEDERQLLRDSMNTARRHFYPEIGNKVNIVEIPKDIYAGLAQAALGQQKQITIRGSCTAESCNLKVKGAEIVEKTTTAGGLVKAVKDINHQLEVRRKQKPSPLTFAIGPSTLTRYNFRFEVKDAQALIASHDAITFEPNPAYPAELQPRLRGRAANKSQVLQMAGNLDPVSLLEDFHSIDRGAPIIGPDNVVESGNGRVMAIQHAINQFPESYNRYREELITRAEQFGIKTDDIASIKHPVLVRLRLTEVNRKQFAEEANLPPALSPSAVETARSDAAKLTPELLSILQVGDDQGIEDALRSSNNLVFARAFLGKLPSTEQAKLVDAKGQLNQDGVRRMAMAIFLFAINGDIGLKLAEKFFESTNVNVRNVFNGLAGSLGVLSRAESMVRKGERDPELAISEDIAQTVTVFSDLKKTPGMTIDKYLSQSQMFERHLNPFQERLLKLLDERSRSGKKIAALFRNYASMVIDSPPPQQSSMLPGGRLTKAELLEQAAKTELTLSQPAPSPVIESYLLKKISICNISNGEAEKVLSWKPIRDYIASAVGIVGDQNVAVCSIGMISGVYGITVRNIPNDKYSQIINRGKAIPRARQVHTTVSGQVIFEVVLPDEIAHPDKPQELHWQIQAVIDKRKGDSGQQTRLFAGAADPILANIAKQLCSIGV